LYSYGQFARTSASKAPYNIPALVFDALLRAAMLRPIVAEFGRYVTLGVKPQNVDFVNNLLKRMPKSSKIISRQLLPWDMFRVEV